MQEHDGVFIFQFFFPVNTVELSSPFWDSVSLSPYQASEPNLVQENPSETPKPQ